MSRDALATELVRDSRPVAREDIIFRFRSAWLSWAAIPFVFLPSAWSPWPVARLAGGIALVAAGAWLRLLAVRSLGKRARVHKLSVESLHTTGIYGLVRNPIYAGAILIAAGLCVILGLFWYLPILIAYLAVVYHLVVLREERYLAESFGDAFAAYALRVPRWIPRRLPFRIRAESPVPWREVFRRERGYLAGLFLAIGLSLAKNEGYETAVDALHRWVSGSRTAFLALLAALSMVLIPAIMILRISQVRAKRAARRYREMLEGRAEAEGASGADRSPGGAP